MDAPDHTPEELPAAILALALAGDWDKMDPIYALAPDADDGGDE